MRKRNESWRMAYGVIAAFALTGLAFGDVYRPRTQAAPSSAPPRPQYVYIDREEQQDQNMHALQRFIVPLHSLDDRSAPLNRDTPFIAVRENPFAGRTTDSDEQSWAAADPNSGMGAQRQEEVRDQSRAQEAAREDSLFAVDRQNMNSASAQMMTDAGHALRPFQELPQRLRPDSELLIHFDSRGQVSLGTIAEKNAEYFHRMVARISDQWNIYFPKFQHFYGLLQEGQVLITFALDLDGRVGEIRLINSYGQTSIDESCINAIRAAAEFGPIPAEYREQGGMVIPFAFVYHRPNRPLKLFH